MILYGLAVRIPVFFGGEQGVVPALGQPVHGLEGMLILQGAVEDSFAQSERWVVWTWPVG